MMAEIASQVVLAIIFGLCIVGYFIATHSRRWILLLGANFAFYALWGLPLVAVLLSSTVLNYLSGLWIYRVRGSNRGRVALYVGLAANLMPLFVFKYLTALLPDTSTLTIVQPLGISYFTFKGLSYILDIHRGKAQPKANIGMFAAYLAFFPQIVAGPIERGVAMLPQIHDGPRWDEGRAIDGLRLILLGAVKKVIIADRLAVYVNAVYSNPQAHHGLNFILAIAFFTIQIYCDFSGYSDLSIGFAQVLGFKVGANFRQPYFSSSIREFWQRWHISLSEWIRDYLFFPVARWLTNLTRRKYEPAVQFITNLFVMGCVGLWHGANWTYVIWGAMHGLFLSIESWFRGPPAKRGAPPRLRDRAGVFVRWGITMAVVAVGWNFFRAQSVADAVYVLTHLMQLPPQPLNISGGGGGVLVPFGLDGVGRFFAAVTGIAFLVVIEFVDARWGLNTVYNRMPLAIRWGIYYGALTAVLLLSASARQQFIYFQF